MKNILIAAGLAMLFATACTPTATIKKSEAYSGMYAEKPVSILLMPPINRSTNVDAKEYFHSTLSMPIAEAGYYVIPTFLSMEILKKESAYDAELFLEAPLSKFGEVFGADLAVFTIIHRWDKSGIAAKVNVEVEYIMKSTKTNEVLFVRRGEVIYDASISTGGKGLLGALVDFTASAINTAATKYVDVARACNSYTFSDMPVGVYNLNYGKDGNDIAGLKNFKVQLNKD
jgi:hypothetical protein